MAKKKSSKGSSKTSSPGSGSLVDDALVTQSVAGAKSAVFGLAMDSIARSNPTHMIPAYVRQALCDWWSGTLPWYVNDADVEPGTGRLLRGTGQTTDSVAARLAVSVHDAEEFGAGVDIAGDNQFLNYTDVPLNPDHIARAAFWRYDLSASEFDPQLMLEPQVVAIDAMSQLFCESFDFHFTFLATLDSEYHRLRRAGPLGVLDDSSETSAWYNMYHFWRDRIEEAYLEGANPLVVLPTGLLNANWTIGDVLDELLALMVDESGQLLADIVISEKGCLNAKTGISLGIYSEPHMTDVDGNPRFIVPQWTAGEIVSNVVGPDRVRNVDISYSSSAIAGSNGSPGPESTFDHSSVVTGESGDLYVTPTSQSWANIAFLLESSERVPPMMRQGATLANGYWDAGALDSDTLDDGWHADFARVAGIGLGIVPLPDESDNYMDPELGLCSFWRGFNLNLAQLIHHMRVMGRSLEPTVKDVLLPMFGRVSDVSTLLVQPQGLTPREHDDLINAYTSSFTYRENPIRTYTAAHLGPVDEAVAAGELVLEGVELTTVQNGNLVTARERYWEPENLDSAGIANVLTYMLPGVEYDTTMLGPITFDAGALGIAQNRQGYPLVDTGLVARLLGTTNSMLTKVEKPVVLPAGVTLPDDTFASGLGPGALELIFELLFSTLGGTPSFGLGHNGFVDWSVSANAEDDHMFATRAEAAAIEGESAYYHGGNAGLVAGAAISAATIARAMPTVAQELEQFRDEDVLSEDGNYVTSWQQLSEDAYPSLAPLVSNTPGDVYNSVVVEVGDHTGQPATRSPLASGGSMVLADQNTYCFTETVAFEALDSWTAWGLPFFDGTANLMNDGVWAAVPMAIQFTGGGTSTVVEISGLEYESTSNEPSLSLAPIGAAEPGAHFWNALSSWDNSNNEISGYSHFPGIEGTEVSLFQANGAYQPTGAGRDIIEYRVPTMSPNSLIMSALHNLVEMDGEAGAALLADNNINVILEVEYHHHNGDFYPASFSDTDVNNEGSGVFRMHHEYNLVSDRVRRTVLPLELSASVQREQVGGVAREIDADVVSMGRSRLTYVMSSVENSFMLGSVGTEGHEYGYMWFTEGPGNPLYGVQGLPNNSHEVADYPIGWHMPLVPGSTACETHALVCIADVPNRLPGGLWGDNILQAVGTIRGDNGEYPQAIGAQYFTIESTCTLDRPIGDYADEDDFFNNWIANPGLMRTGGNFVYAYSANNQQEFLIGNGVNTVEAPATLLPHYREKATAKIPGEYFVMRNRSVGSVHSYVGGSASLASWIIPDDPEQRMVYRPYRNIVDAAVLKELKLLLMPTHERVDPLGGVIGLPYYGQPTRFRFAQLFYDVGRPEQFILEQAATKTRMIDSSNRGQLVFSKATLLDENSGRHTLAQAVRDINAMIVERGMMHSSGSKGIVYTIPLIRDLQMGRQFQRF